MRDQAKHRLKDSSIMIIMAAIVANIAGFFYGYAIDGEAWTMWIGKIIIMVFGAYMGIRISTWWQARDRATEKGFEE